MTGFGKATAEAENKKYTVEIKSLNSKQMDLSARIPSSLRSTEIEVRNLVAHELQRGKVDVIITVESLPGTNTPVKLNLDTLTAYKAQVSETCKSLGVDEPQDWMPLLMRFPDVLVSETEDTASDQLADTLIKVTSQAVTALTEHRRAEGARLEEFFEMRIATIADLLGQVEPFEKERVPKIREKMTEALAAIPNVEYDKGRLEQEMIFYLEKLDVNEERQRLGQHLRYFLETIAAEPGQGKKLGFIAQEMGREINTLGSKSNHAEMQKIVVRMKDILEQIKEQVLNVL